MPQYIKFICAHNSHKNLFWSHFMNEAQNVLKEEDRRTDGWIDGKIDRKTLWAHNEFWCITLKNKNRRILSHSSLCTFKIWIPNIVVHLSTKTKCRTYEGKEEHTEIRSDMRNKRILERQKANQEQTEQWKTLMFSKRKAVTPRGGNSTSLKKPSVPNGHNSHANTDTAQGMMVKSRHLIT